MMTEPGPITVYPEDGKWVVDYVSYARGFHDTEEDAIATATKAAQDEGRELVIDREKTADERDRIADERNSIADERDRVADARDKGSR